MSSVAAGTSAPTRRCDRAGAGGSTAARPGPCRRATVDRRDGPAPSTVDDADRRRRSRSVAGESVAAVRPRRAAWPRQRMPLPLISARLPSALRSTMRHVGAVGAPGRVADG